MDRKIQCMMKKLGWCSFCLYFAILKLFLEVIIDAFTEAGLVLEKDARQKLKV